MAASMSSTATPMWSILPNKAASLCGRGKGVLAVAALDPEDLGHRGEADLELLGTRLPGRQVALDLAAGRVEGLGQGIAVVAVAPGEHLDRDRGAGEADGGAGEGARALDPPRQHIDVARREP